MHISKRRWEGRRKDFNSMAAWKRQESGDIETSGVVKGCGTRGRNQQSPGVFRGRETNFSMTSQWLISHRPSTQTDNTPDNYGTGWQRLPVLMWLSQLPHMYHTRGGCAHAWRWKAHVRFLYLLFHSAPTLIDKTPASRLSIKKNNPLDIQIHFAVIVVIIIIMLSYVCILEIIN